MAYLVGNGTNLYRISNSLTRTPITITLRPDDKAIYQIGDPHSMDSAGYLHGGFIQNGTYSSVVQSVGYMLANEMINGRPRWQDANGSHDPEFVWYQGAYSTSSSSISLGKQWSEAYAAICAFHFTVPNVMRGKDYTIQVNFLNMGGVWAYGPGVNGNSANKNIVNADYGWSYPSGWPVSFHHLTSTTPNYHMMDINANSPYDVVDASSPLGAGNFTGRRDLWELGGSGVDGWIPTLTNPTIQSYTPSTTILNQFKSVNGGWFVPTIHPTLDSTSQYSPSSGYGGDGANNYWGCFSLRDVTVTLTYDPS